jgi:succinate dehydrogenase/fumarate reductase cytochrome b subunit
MTDCYLKRLDMILIATVVIFAVVCGIRLFFNSTTPIVTTKVTPTVTCASMVTAGRAAISCWKD